MNRLSSKIQYSSQLVTAVLLVVALQSVTASEPSPKRVKGSTKAYNKLEVLVDIESNHLKKKLKYAWKKDPFLKVPGFVAKSVRRPTLKLRAVLYSESERSAAVINGKTIFVNSMIEGFRIKEIGPNFVIVTKGDSMRELQLAPIENKIVSEIDFWDRAPATEDSIDSKGEEQ